LGLGCGTKMWGEGSIGPKQHQQEKGRQLRFKGREKKRTTGKKEEDRKEK